MKIKFTIPGKPVPQGRPRFYRRGKYVAAVDPKNSRVYKKDISYIVSIEKEKMGLKEKDLLFEDGPIRLTVHAFFPCPKSQWRKTKPRAERHHAKRPDADNVAKGIKDGLSGVLYRDDGQISELIVKKRIAAQGEAPRVEIEVELLDEEIKK